MKKLCSLLLTVALLLSGCGAGAPAETTVPATQETAASTETVPAKKTRDQMHIFISLPDEASPRWQRAGEDVQMLLQNLTYQVTLSYSNNDAREQERLLEQALLDGVDCILLAPVDSVALSHFCNKAHEQSVPVVTYDRLVLYTEGVDYHVSYDYKAIGREMAEHILEKTALDTVEKPLTVEFFMGAPEDNTALLLYDGVMEVLQPYMENGQLVTNSGRTAFEDVCTLDWDASTVEETLRSYLQEYYKGGRPDILCTVSDHFADTCIRVLEERKLALPLITGLEATETGIANIETGKQSFTVAVDMELLNEKCVELVDSVLVGKEPELNDVENCHNNAVTVPAYLCAHTVVLPTEAEISEDAAPATE